MRIHGMNATYTDEGKQVKYLGKVYRVIKRGYLGNPNLYKLASRTEDGSPFGAEIARCKAIR